jgi:hypothetical protein
MRKLGFILLIFEFIWVTFVAIEAVPVAHALNVDLILQKPQQQFYTRDEVVKVSAISKYTVAHFAMWGFAGGLLMLAGGIVLGKSDKKNSDAKPPAL